MEEVGEGVTRVKPGDRCIMSFVSNCGHCRTCRIGLPNICETNLETGASQYDGTTRLHDGDSDIYQMGKLGAFAEYIVVPQQACQPIPDGVPFSVGALIGCRVTTGVGAVINSPAARAGMSVAVFGCGGVGLNVIQGARLVGASRIIAVDIYDHKLEFSYKFGATDIINSREVDPVDPRDDPTEGGFFHTMESGSQDAVNRMVIRMAERSFFQWLEGGCLEEENQAFEKEDTRIPPETARGVPPQVPAPGIRPGPPK